MLASFLGDKTFRQGLTNYLNSKWVEIMNKPIFYATAYHFFYYGRRYGNAVQDDLWESFTQQAKTDKVSLPATVKQIMDTWTLKMGTFIRIPFHKYINLNLC